MLGTVVDGPRNFEGEGVTMPRRYLVLAVALSTAVSLAGCSSLATVSSGPATASQGSVQSDEQTKPADEPKSGTRQNPAAIGSTIEGREWTVVVNSVTLAATDVVMAANAFNQQPAAGNEYIVVNYTVTYKGDDANGSMPAFVSLDYVTAAGATVDRLAKVVVAPDPEMSSMAALYTGASATGNIAIEAPSPVDGVLAVTPGILSDKVFVAIQ